MKIYDKVVWSNGMLLDSLHLRQQERYFEYLLTTPMRFKDRYPWGIVHLKIDEHLLALGKIGIETGSGIFPDGTYFNIANRDKAPLTMDIPIQLSGAIIYLGIPLKRTGVPETGIACSTTPKSYRYEIETILMQDYEEETAEIPIQLARLSLHLLSEKEDKEGFSCLGIARILEVKADNQVILDTHYFPSCMNIHAIPALTNHLKEIINLLHYRGNKISQCLTTDHISNISEIKKFLLLQIINRYESLLVHLKNLVSLHPEYLYTIFIQLAGELATFTAYQHRPILFSTYEHNCLNTIFLEVIQELKQALSLVLEENAIVLSIAEKTPNTWISSITEKSLLDEANFILAVHAALSATQIRTYFPTQTKIAPVEELPTLINRALPGITLNPLFTIPHQIPYHSNFTYFSLDTHHPLWEILKDSGELAFHIGGEFPKLKIELWAIKDKYYE